MSKSKRAKFRQKNRLRKKKQSPLEKYLAEGYNPPKPRRPKSRGDYLYAVCKECLGEKWVLKSSGMCDRCIKYQTTRPDYWEYIHSDLWELRAYRAKKSAGFKCKDCGKKSKELHVHHLTYIRLGHELPEDLVVLCPKCHNDRHTTNPSSKTIAIPNAS